MATINELKERTVTETPLLLFECEMASGAVERWSTHEVTFEGERYEARVLRHNLFEMRSGSDDGIDALARISLTLANADSHFSQVERETGWKGAKVTVRFVFFDLKQGAAASEGAVLFRGVADAPEEITESTLRLNVTNSLNLQRVLLPDVRVERRCPWKFPSGAAQRAEAVVGGDRGKYSPFYRCGYSPDQAGGMGNMDATAPFTRCAGTREQCEARGMFSEDGSRNPTRRFGGIEFVPPSTVVRSYGEKGRHVSSAVENEARYNDFVPLVYGTAWYAPLIVFSKNDGNLTRIEALLGMGEIEGVLKVLVNDIEIPMGRAGADMTGTGWFSMITRGGRCGSFNPDYVSAAGAPLGDPYGSMAVLSVVVPNRINDGRSLPNVQVLLEGLKLDQFGSDGLYKGESFTNNPAWVLLDILRRCGWRLEDIDVASFGQAAEYCGEEIAAVDLHGNAISIPRFQCNLALIRRRSAADVIRGIRNGARLYLTYSLGGQLQLRAENTLALQQAAKPAGSNSTEPLDGGWPAYEFGDGSNGISGILRRESGEASIRVWSRSTAETPNRLSVEFQDTFNEYQQDSLTLTDIDDVLRAGQEVSVAAAVLGLPNFDQAARILKFQLDKAVTGNTYVEFETSVRGVSLRPGDLITVSYLKEGFERQPFRVLRLAPGLNCRTTVVTAQIHHDWWYTDSADAGNSGSGRQQASEVGMPRPLTGNVVDEEGAEQYGIVERSAEGTDGSSQVTLEAGFAAPRRAEAGRAGIPKLSLAARTDAEGGTLAGDQTLYYAVSGIDGDGAESALSFVVRAAIPGGTNTNSVTLQGLSFSSGTARFNVYRGTSPSKLLLISAEEAVRTEFTDIGFESKLAPPPDENYDHANFYWRLELQPECEATVHSANAIGNSELSMNADAYRGMVVRITKGKGAGQERAVAGNDATTVTIAGTWATEPDATSRFVIAESGWHFGATASSSPVEFEVPNRVGATVHVSGRSANAHDRECGYELSPVTRWRIKGAGAPADANAPSMPAFGFATSGRGGAELGAIGFADMENTRTISSATLTVHYWNELKAPCGLALSQAVAKAEEFVSLSRAGQAEAGGLVQIEGEILEVLEVLDGGLRYRVSRGAKGSTANGHAEGSVIYELEAKVFVVPFAPDFFGSPASGNFAFPITLPNVRVAAAELFMTNVKGNSPTAVNCYAGTAEAGLRTLAGGQFTIQVEGFLAIETNAAPLLVVQEARSVRDIFAMVHEAPTVSPVEMEIRQDDEVLCRLTIPPGDTMSNVVDGSGLPALKAGSVINLDITGVGQTADSLPGKDLTVTVRL
jgi:hypothetical protein